MKVYRPRSSAVQIKFHRRYTKLSAEYKARQKIFFLTLRWVVVKQSDIIREENLMGAIVLQRPDYAHESRNNSHLVTYFLTEIVLKYPIPLAETGHFCVFESFCDLMFPSHCIINIIRLPYRPLSHRYLRYI